MQGTMSKNLCEAPRTMQIRSTPQLPRRSANLWSDMDTPRLCEEESVLEISRALTISKRRYGMEAEGSPISEIDRMKSKAR